MSKKAIVKSFIPRLDGRALDAVKGIAAALMVVDHINTIWLNDDVAEMMLLGRVVFPLFCYAVAVALLRDDSRKKHEKYFTSLMILAFISEPVIELARPDSPLNVIFTLAFGIFFADLARRLKDWQIYFAYGASILAATTLNMQLEFGLPGVMLPSAIMLVMEGRNRFIPALLLLLFAANIAGIHDELGHLPGLSMTSTSVIEMVMAVGLFASVIPYLILVVARELPQTGRYLSRYSLHVFYPAHQLILWALGLYFFH
jgi:hypothetical protein